MSSAFDPFALSEFARYYGFHYDIIDSEELVEDVLMEMERGLRGSPSSLPMIPAYINPVSRISSQKTVVALDAGGTNLRSALVKFDENGKAEILDSRKAPMPGTRGRLDTEAFFDEIACLTAPLIEAAGDKIDGIGFCFSFNMEITKEADGILRAFSKEVDAPELLGKAIGAELMEALGRKKLSAPPRIVLLNDTVATLLSGLSEMPAQAGPILGFILGTGFNTAYPEVCIPKIGFDDPINPQVVVCESGNYAHRYMGSLDREFDSHTQSPGAYTLEKAASGAYIGPLTFHILRRAVKDGIFSFNKSEEFLSWPSLQSKELNEFLHEPLSGRGPIGELFGKDDLGAIKSFVYLSSIVSERGALLSAAVLAAAVEKATAAYDPLAPVRIAVEGSTYMLYKGMRKALESCLHVMLNRNMPRPFVIAPVEQASLLGAAVAALSRPYEQA
ncbi:MAG: hexokinase [Treponema sp.]|nr:hexokinase [Treponema sp.]